MQMSLNFLNFLLQVKNQTSGSKTVGGFFVISPCFLLNKNRIKNEGKDQKDGIKNEKTHAQF